MSANSLSPTSFSPPSLSHLVLPTLVPPPHLPHLVSHTFSPPPSLPRLLSPQVGHIPLFLHSEMHVYPRSDAHVGSQLDSEVGGLDMVAHHVLCIGFWGGGLLDQVMCLHLRESIEARAGVRGWVGGEGDGSAGGVNWEDSMDDDINVFQPSPCLSQHLADLPVGKCCESGLEPCDRWCQGTIEAVPPLPFPPSPLLSLSSLFFSHVAAPPPSPFLCSYLPPSPHPPCPSSALRHTISSS